MYKNICINFNRIKYENETYKEEKDTASNRKAREYLGNTQYKKVEKTISQNNGWKDQ